jgi:hypothetical protein
MKDRKLTKTIRYNLQLHDLSVARADKGKTVVILNMVEYNTKVINFIWDNIFTKIEKDPMKIYHKQVKQIINDSNIIQENINGI